MERDRQFEEGDVVVCVSKGRPEYGQTFVVTKGTYEIPWGGPMIDTDGHSTGIFAGYFAKVSWS